MLLDDLGLEDVPVVELDQASSQGYHGDLGSLGPNFRRMAWRGIILTDLLQKICRQTRPYEVTRGDCDQLYALFVDRIEGAVERGENLVPIARDIVSAFCGVAVDRSVPRPKVGVVGEIYVRCNAYCNNFLAAKLEALGAQVTLPALEEWVDYIGFERRTDSWTAGDYKGYLTEVVTSWFQEREVRRMTRPFEGAIREFAYETHTAEVLELAKPYLDFAIRGEAVLSMGRLVEYAHHGYDGVVNVIPFNCMPGTIVDALMERYRRYHPDMPILKMSYDGLTHVGEDTRVEAFMYQCQQHADARVGEAALA
jgi:predicted nucleotide-binding protein (sugar kinase/HSP70/actin superfamily)